MPTFEKTGLGLIGQATVISKVGGAVASGIGSGADASTLGKVGGAFALGASSGAKQLVANRTGSAIAYGVASGFVFRGSRTAAAGLVWLFGDQEGLTKAGKGVATGIGSGSKIYSGTFVKTGAGIASGFAGGARVGGFVPGGPIPGLLESLLSADRPLAWWGLDTTHATTDETGHGYTLTAVGAPASGLTLVPRTTAEADAGSRDFNGTSDAYYTLGSLTEPPTTPPPFHASSTATDTTADATIVSPGGVKAGDLMLVCLVHTTATTSIASAPAGWTQIGTTLNASNCAATIYRRTVPADEPPTEFRWTWQAAGQTATTMLVYRGCDIAVAGLVYDSGQQATTAASFHSTTTETNPVQAHALAFWCNDSTAVITPNPTGLTTRATAQGGSVKVVAAEYNVPTAGSVTKTASTSASTVLGAFLLTFGSPNVVIEDRLDSLSSKVSIHAFIRPDTVAAGVRTIIRKQNSWGLHLNGAVLEFVYRDGSGVDRTIAGPSMSASVPTHVVVADDGTTIHFWKDGVQTTGTRLGAAGYTKNANRVVVGAAYDGAAYSSFFDGRLDEVAVFGAALSDQMVQTYYTAATGGTFGRHLLGDAVTFPGFKLEIAWASGPTDDTLVWEDVTADVRADVGIATARGRNFELDRIETGRMDFTLSNRTGKYDPENTASPYYPNVRPTRAVRLRAQAAIDGIAHPIFFGYTEGHPLRRPYYGKDSIAVFTCSDAFKALSLDKVPTTLVRAQETAGKRIAAVLAGVPGIPFQGDTGQHQVIGDDLVNTNRLEHSQATAETDGGVLFAGRDGTVVYQDTHYRVKNERASRATYGDGGGSELPIKLLEPQTDEARLFTAASVTPSSGNVKTAKDDVAVGQHFVRTRELTTTHVFDNDAQAMAEAFAHRYATPRRRIPAVRIQPATHSTPLVMWETVLAHEISHRITTVERPIGMAAAISRPHFIEGLSHSIRGDDWVIDLSVSPADLDGDLWLLGTGALGTSTGLTATALGW